MRLVQLKKGDVRRVGLVDEPHLRLLEGCPSIYELARNALLADASLTNAVRRTVGPELIPYDEVYSGQSEWHILPAIDHPDEPARCLLSGTGLTHLGSARNRQSMHELRPEEITDSMKMFQWGVEGGRPAEGCVGTAPEWFYKGTGFQLRAHGAPLEIPPYAEDGGEEAEIAGIYLIGRDGQPYRLGMAVGNEFADHSFEKKNYLNLAGSKLRTCSLGPELVIDPNFESVEVRARIERAGAMLWSKTFRSGEREMCHNLQNIEHHHFKYESHRRPGDLHVHFFGTDCLSFSEGVRLRTGDVMEVSAEGFGRALRNPVHAAETPNALVTVKALA